MKNKKYLTKIKYISGLQVAHRPLITFALVLYLLFSEEIWFACGHRVDKVTEVAVFLNQHFSTLSPVLFLVYLTHTIVLMTDGNL